MQSYVSLPEDLEGGQHGWLPDRCCGKFGFADAPTRISDSDGVDHVKKKNEQHSAPRPIPRGFKLAHHRSSRLFNSLKKILWVWGGGYILQRWPGHTEPSGF